MQQITVFWFRQDLRIFDNPGLFEAAKTGTVLPVYILDDSSPGIFKMGEASRWWLHHSLKSLNDSLNGNLNIYKGDSHKVIANLINTNNVTAIYWNRCYEPWRIENDSIIKTYIQNKNIQCQSFNGSLLWEPWEVLKKDSTPYKVFTPFYKNGCLQAQAPRMPLPKPDNLLLATDKNNHETIESLNLMPKVGWDKQMKLSWDIGEHAAKLKLIEFSKNALNGYKEGRNYPFKNNISRLSPHLHFGEISPNQAWHVAKIKGESDNCTNDSDCFLSELGWREFSYSLMYNFPNLPVKNFQPKFDNFPWKYNQEFLIAWQQGKTGYPIVDAGMRELWQTGYMHNRVRMIVGSFLVKNLLQHWHYGRDWFWDCLVDADLANNSSGWQWIAGSGADAAPYFRIFNAVTQGEKFDEDGSYTRKFIPELSKLPKEYLFKPWEAPKHILSECNIVLGSTYPNPIVNLQQSRNIALEAYSKIS